MQADLYNGRDFSGGQYGMQQAQFFGDQAWTEEEHARFLAALDRHRPPYDWNLISVYVGTRNAAQVQQHANLYFVVMQRQLPFQQQGAAPLRISVRDMYHYLNMYQQMAPDYAQILHMQQQMLQAQAQAAATGQQAQQQNLQAQQQAAVAAQAAFLQQQAQQQQQHRAAALQQQLLQHQQVQAQQAQAQAQQRAQQQQQQQSAQLQLQQQQQQAQQQRSAPGSAKKGGNTTPTRSNGKRRAGSSDEEDGGGAGTGGEEDGGKEGGNNMSIEYLLTPNGSNKRRGAIGGGVGDNDNGDKGGKEEKKAKGAPKGPRSCGTEVTQEELEQERLESKDRCDMEKAAEGEDEGNRWDWVRKRILGPRSYQFWFPMFKELIPLNKREMAEDLRVIKATPEGLTFGENSMRDDSRLRPNAPKRPVKQQEVNEDDGENWVQCDRCMKWRRLPDFVDMKDIQKQRRWFCEMNPDRKRNKCNIPEPKPLGNGGQERLISSTGLSQQQKQIRR